MIKKRVYFTIGPFSIRIETSTPYVLKFFKKQYGLAPHTKRSSQYRLIFNVDPLSNFKLHVGAKNAEISFPKYEDYSHLSFFFNFIVQLFALHHDILLIHASSIEKNKWGYVFSGPSGIGKTTIIKKVKPHYIYSNDVTVLKKEKNGYMLLCSPFDRYFASSKKPVKLKKVFFLNQSNKTISERLSSSKGYERLLKNSIFYYFLDTIVIVGRGRQTDNSSVDIKIPNYSSRVQKNFLRLLALHPPTQLHKKKSDEIYALVESL